MKPGDEWRFLRMCFVLLCASTMVYVTIPDYGWELSLFENLAYDPTGWLHEIAYIAVLFGLAIEWTFRCEMRQFKVSRHRRGISS